MIVKLNRKEALGSATFWMCLGVGWKGDQGIVKTKHSRLRSKLALVFGGKWKSIKEKITKRSIYFKIVAQTDLILINSLIFLST